MNQYLIVSINDVSPAFSSELDEIIKELDSRGITRRSLFVIPNMENAAPISSSKKLSEILINEAVTNELCLHGYNHSKKGNDREFKYLDYFSAYEKIMQGLEEIDKLGLETKGFVPPFFKISKEGIKAVKERFEFLVTNPKIFDLKNNKEYSSIPLWYWPYNQTIDKIFRLYNSFLENIYLKKNDLIRVDIHPQDIWNSKPLDCALKTISSLSEERKLVSHIEYLENTFQKQ